MYVTPYSIAESFKYITEEPGSGRDHPLIMAMLTLDHNWPKHDEVAWCSALPNFIHHMLGLERSKSLMAQSWLQHGVRIELSDARIGFDLVVLSRDGHPDWGHCGYYSGHRKNYIYLLGGNQSNGVNVAQFSMGRVLDIRRF